MAKFYGIIESKGRRVTRCGTKTGLETTAASYSGAVRTYLYENGNGIECARVELIPWGGAGVYHVLYDGPVSGGSAPEVTR